MSAHQRYLEAPYAAADRMEMAHEHFVDNVWGAGEGYDGEDSEAEFDRWMEDQEEPDYEPDDDPEPPDWDRF